MNRKELTCYILMWIVGNLYYMNNYKCPAPYLYRTTYDGHNGY